MRSKRVSRRRRRPVFFRVSLAGVALLLGTTHSAHQDLGSLLAKQNGVADRARAHLLSGAVASLKTATFSLPTGSIFALPQSPLRPSIRIDEDVTGSIPPAAYPQRITAPAVVRKNKTDRVAALPLKKRELPPLPAYDIALSLELNPEIPEAEAIFANEPRADHAGSLAHANDLPVADPQGMFQLGRLFFDADDAALPPGAFRHRQPVPPAVTTEASPDGVKTRVRTPAERLELAGASRTKAHRCLANAIYFEARSEPERGQIAVAQVVINRAFSGYYPNDICGVVYQNKHRHLSCQFTFACDGIPDVVHDKSSWEAAERLANETLDGKLYLDDVGKATHYHAYYVSPYWARSMRKMSRIGAHTFYYPRQWEQNELPAQAAK